MYLLYLFLYVFLTTKLVVPRSNARQYLLVAIYAKRAIQLIDCLPYAQQRRRVQSHKNQIARRLRPSWSAYAQVHPLYIFYILIVFLIHDNFTHPTIAANLHTRHKAVLYLLYYVQSPRLQDQQSHQTTSQQIHGGLSLGILRFLRDAKSIIKQGHIGPPSCQNFKLYSNVLLDKIAQQTKSLHYVWQ